MPIPEIVLPSAYPATTYELRVAFDAGDVGFYIKVDGEYRNSMSLTPADARRLAYFLLANTEEAKPAVEDYADLAVLYMNDLGEFNFQCVESTEEATEQAEYRKRKWSEKPVYLINFVAEYKPTRPSHEWRKLSD